MGKTTLTRAVGHPLARIEALEKVTGAARYAYEHGGEDVAYAWIVGAEIARGRVRAVHDGRARSAPGVLDVLWHANAPRLRDTDDDELALLQSPEVSYRGQVVAVVVAQTLEDAREAATLVDVDYEAERHDVLLRPDHPKLYTPESVAGVPPTPADTAHGDFDSAYRDAAVKLDATYETPAEHNNPMEPHATTAAWEADGSLTVHDSTQGASDVRAALAALFGLEPNQVRVIAPHVGGGFGAKGTPRPNVVLAAMAAQAVGRSVKLAITRQQMFQLTGYRTPTIQRLRLGAGTDGRLVAIAHDVVEQTATIREFPEQTAAATRMMYAAPNRRTTHRIVRLDVPANSWLRAPGECPGMYALESAMDELAVACGIDPIELRMRNEPDTDPEEGTPFSSRNLIACLHEGAERFGWADRDPTPGARRDGRSLVGSGVAAATYPAWRAPSQAVARALGDGRFSVGIAAADIGTGARTVLTQIAADALGVEPDRVELVIGDTAQPRAPVAGGSSGTASWGSAVLGACEALRREGGDEASYDTAEDIERQEDFSRHAFGAHFAEVRVDVDSGEIRVERMLGVYAAGRILNPLTARSQFIGAMIMGISMALHEESVPDREFGDYVNHDLAQYHVPVNADIRELEAHWIDEHDPHLNPMGSKGIGEIGIVGTAAAVANAVFHATGLRFRTLPIRPDRVIEGLPNA